MDKIEIKIYKPPYRIPILYKRPVILPHKEIQYSKSFLKALKNSIYQVETELYSETFQRDVIEDEGGNMEYVIKTKPKRGLK
jgi:hypothetical protein